MKIQRFLQKYFTISAFSGFFEKPDPGSGSGVFFSLKPSCGKTELTKKEFSQITPAVPELLSFRHTYRQTKTLITL